MISLFWDMTWRMLEILDCSTLVPGTEYLSRNIGNQQPMQATVLMDFIPLCCGALVMIYILLPNTTNLLNPTVHTTCFGLLRRSSGNEVQNLKPKYVFFKIILKFVRSKNFYISTVHFNILHLSMALLWTALNILIEFIPLCWSKSIINYILSSNTTDY
jgi:hypothetical protein